MEYSSTLLWIIIVLIILIIFMGSSIIIIRRLKISEIRHLQEIDQKLRQDLVSTEEKITNWSDKHERSMQRESDLNRIVAQRETQLANLEEKLSTQKGELENLQQQFSRTFEIVAHKILEEKTTKFTHQNQENLQHILAPLQEKIQRFERKVEDTNKESIDRHAQLRQQILGLQELNQQMSKEATNLTRALKGDSKIQGNWGELVLERVLEKSNLQKGSEYEVQQSFQRTDGSKAIPDVVVHLPQGKKMIIDSKVSLLDYEKYVNSDDEVLKEHALKDHLRSLQRHVEQLSAKNYHTLYQMESPDFVLMFVPIEPAFAVAINHDNSLYNKAFEKNVVIVTPTTLLATLRTIDSMWNQEKQQKNATEIALQAGKLYDQFVNLLDDFEKIGKQLQTVQGSYEGTMKKFTGRGNLLTKIDHLKKLGAKTSKNIDPRWLDRLEEPEETL